MISCSGPRVVVVAAALRPVLRSRWVTPCGADLVQGADDHRGLSERQLAKAFGLDGIAEAGRPLDGKPPRLGPNRSIK